MSASTILSTIAPQFDSTAGKDTYLEFAALQVNEDFFGTDRYDYAVAYMAAHLLTLDTNYSVVGLSSGAVTSKKEGDLTVNFATISGINIDPTLGQTSYGRQFLQLRNSSGCFVSSSNYGGWTGWPTPPGGGNGAY